MSLPFLNTAPGYDEELRNSVFFERGLHATSICGAVGAAVAVTMLQGQDEAGIASAAGMRPGAGLLEANRTGGTIKRVHCGVAAADLARHGLSGPPTVLEGRFGFLQAFCGDRAHPDDVRGLGTAEVTNLLGPPRRSRVHRTSDIRAEDFGNRQRRRATPARSKRRETTSAKLRR